MTQILSPGITTIDQYLQYEISRKFQKELGIKRSVPLIHDTVKHILPSIYEGSSIKKIESGRDISSFSDESSL
jgi:hypothetical protein